MIHQLFFSPTRTGEALVSAVADGMLPQKSSIINITMNAVEKSFSSEDLVLTVVPVYAGRVPDTALERLSKLRGSNTPTVLITVYGNRDYDDALLELADFMKMRGFKVIAAAAFIGEHSYSTSELPIAESRPDSADLGKAGDFGRELSQIWKTDVPEPRLPGNRPYREKKEGTPFSPLTSEALCTTCCECVDVCPVEAIDHKNPLQTDKELCIHCAACIKICAAGARSFPEEIIGPIAEMLHTRCSGRKEPELFLPVL